MKKKWVKPSLISPTLQQRIQALSLLAADVARDLIELQKINNKT